MWKTMMVEVAQIRMMSRHSNRFDHNGNPHGLVDRPRGGHGLQVHPWNHEHSHCVITSRSHCPLKLVPHSAGGVVEFGQGRASPAKVKFLDQRAVQKVSNGVSMVGVGGAARARRGECSLLRAHTALSSIAVLFGKFVVSFYLAPRRCQPCAPK